MSNRTRSYSCDVLVIGGGLAGTMAAISAAQTGAKVILLVKGRVGESGSSSRSGGIIAAPFGHTAGVDGESWDSPSCHVADTVLAGAGLCSEPHVAVLAQDVCSGILELARLGVEFSKTPEGRFHQLKAPGNSRPRACSVIGAGAALMARLRQQLLAHGVELLEDTTATDLLMEEGAVVGVAGIRALDSASIAAYAPATVLASGGTTGLFQTVSGDSRNTGDGLAMAFEAGAELSNLEFVEFTLIYRVNGKVLKLGGLAPFLSRGCVLVNSAGERFMERYFPPDVVARAVRSHILQAVTREIAEGRGPIFLDCSPVPETSWDEFEKSQGALMLHQIRAAGGDYRNGRIEVLTAAHSLLAGLVTDTNAATTLKGLWAAGECATGVHGAARLSGNGLAACLVFGRRAGQNGAHFAIGRKRNRARHVPRPHAPIDLRAGKSRSRSDTEGLREKISAIADASLGVIRDRLSLTEGRDRFRALAFGLHCATEARDTIDEIELRHLCRVGELMTSAALLRKESRGLHFRTDVTTADPAWRKWLVVRKNLPADDPKWTDRTQLSNEGRPVTFQGA